MDLSQPPPQLLTAPSALATNFTSMPPPSMGGQHYRHYHPHHGAGKQGYNHFKPFMPGGFQRPFGMSQDDFDGKRLRKSVMRKTVDYNASIIKGLEVRILRMLIGLYTDTYYSLGSPVATRLSGQTGHTAGQHLCAANAASLQLSGQSSECDNDALCEDCH